MNGPDRAACTSRHQRGRRPSRRGFAAHLRVTARVSDSRLPLSECPSRPHDAGGMTFAIFAEGARLHPTELVADKAHPHSICGAVSDHRRAARGVRYASCREPE